MATTQDTPAVLRAREDHRPAERVALSAATRAPLDGFHAWFSGRRAAQSFRVDRIPFADLERWGTDPATGNLAHETGRFFSVEGLRVETLDEPERTWQQPVIRQPEVGILGILVKEFGGVLHFLMQAKMEPGNPNLLQLSPTVQATRSNYTKAHGGAAVRYLEYFTRPGQRRVLADVLQSEHGAWFHRKHNRNMVVEVEGDVQSHEDFHWLTLGQLAQLLGEDNLVNMDSRTVLSCLPRSAGRDTSWALHTDAELRSWLTGERARSDVRADCVPLSAISGWHRTETEISHEEGLFFDVTAVSVEAGRHREVAAWTQPLFRPRGRGVAAFLTRRINGVPHLLAHARMEGGLRDTVEIAPTVQRIPSNYVGVTSADRPPYLDEVLTAEAPRMRYEAVHSEEGGRFLGAESRYLIVEADPAVPVYDVPPGYRWMTPDQLVLLIGQGNCVNVQARTLVACFAAAGLGGGDE